MSRSPSITCPSARAPGITSCIRFKQRMKVLLPHPEGPMSAVTLLAWYIYAHVREGLEGAVERREVLDLHAKGRTFARGCTVTLLPHVALVPRHLGPFRSLPVFSISTRLTPFFRVD